MVIDEILISALGEERRAAFLDRGRLVRFALSLPSDDTRHGDVFVGRIARVETDLGAAFVDLEIGPAGVLMETDARLRPSDSGRIRDLVAEGDAVLVQVIREAENEKGPKLTRRIMLGGRLLSLLAHTEGVSATPEEDAASVDTTLRQRLMELIAGPYGFRLHRGSGEVPTASIVAEARGLATRYHALLDEAAAGTTVKRLYRGPDAVQQALRTYLSTSVQQLVMDSAALVVEVRNAFPEFADRVSLHRDPGTLFRRHDVTDQLDDALQPTLRLPSGGSVTFMEIPGFTLIDVDTAAARIGQPERTALRVNLETMDLLAVQIPLRDLSGYIAIDVVPMRRRPHREQVERALRDALAHDERETVIGGHTRLGMIEFTRERRGPSLASRLKEPCRACDGSGQVPAGIPSAHDALRVLLAEAAGTPGRRWMLRLSPSLVDALAGPAGSALAEVEYRLGQKVNIEPSPDLPVGEFQVIGTANDRESVEAGSSGPS